MRYIIPLVNGSYTEGDSAIVTEGTRNDSSTHKFIVSINGAPQGGKITIQSKSPGRSNWSEVDYTFLSEVNPQTIEYTGEISQYRFIVQDVSGSGSVVISDTEEGEAITPFGMFGTTGGMTPGEIGESLEFGKKKSPVIWLGIDSLTAGSGGFSYQIPFEKMARGAAGWGGRYIPFTNETTWGECSIFKSGFSLLEDLAYTSDLRAKSLNGFGAYATTGGNVNFQLQPQFNWAYADLYYLQQPTGGSVSLDRPEGQTAITLDTEGVESLQKIRVFNHLLDGTTADGTKTTANAFRIRNATLDGDFCCFGVLFYSGDSGPIFINAAKGGQKTSEFVQLNNEYQTEWFAQLEVTHAVVNAGMNDRTVSTPEVFSSDLNTLCSRFPQSVKQIIVRPNDPSDLLLDQYDSVYSDIADTYGDLFDVTEFFGGYSEMNANGLMLDGVHPNLHFQYHFAQYICNLIFGRSFYVDTPPLIDYIADPTQ